MDERDEPSLQQLRDEVETLRARVQELERQRVADEQCLVALRRMETILHATLDSAADGILAVDEKGHVIVSNRQFAKMWRIPPDLIEAGDDNELLNFVLGQLAHPEAFLAKVRELYQSYQASSDTLQFKDGRVFARYSQPLVVDDKLYGRVWTFRDMTASGTVTRARPA